MNTFQKRTVRIAVGARRGSSLGPVPPSYLRSLAAAGATAEVVLPERHRSGALASSHGLLLTGGGDVDPELYDNEMASDGLAVDRLRDDAELALLGEARERGLPVMAICHGMQLLNVAHGGTLEALAPAIAGAHGTSEAWTRHAVALLAGSRPARAVKDTMLRECSSHHQQGLARLGDGLVAVGHSADGVVEAIEDPRAPWTVGLLWHPEDTAPDDAAQQRLFMAFVDAAREAGR